MITTSLRLRRRNLDNDLFGFFGGIAGAFYVAILRYPVGLKIGNLVSSPVAAFVAPLSGKSKPKTQRGRPD